MNETIQEVKLLDHGYLNYIEHWGSDERIIEAARMSTQKGFKGWGQWACKYCEARFAGEPIICSNCQSNTFKLLQGDEKLLRYLWEHKHYTPFEMAGLTIEVQAPIFVFREWHRHRTQSYNEMSGRYTELPELIYMPSVERLMSGGQSKVNKQSSEAAFTEEQALQFRAELSEAYDYSYITYKQLLDKGVARELARLVLPTAIYSKMRASANLRNWLAFLHLRMDPAAQWEIRQYANALAKVVAVHFPRTYELFEEGLSDTNT